MNRTTKLVVACILLVLGGFVYYYVKDEPLPPPSPAQTAQSNPMENIIFSGTTIVEEKDGRRVWEFSAETIEMDPNTKLIHLRNLKALLYRTDGKTVELIAAEGTLDTQTREAFVRGEAKAVNSDGSVLTAKEFRYDGKERRLFAAGDVTLRQDDTVITGDNLESTANMEKFKLFGNARVRKGGVTP